MKACPFCGSSLIGPPGEFFNFAVCAVCKACGPSEHIGWDVRAAPPVTRSILDLIRSCLDIEAEVSIDEHTARGFLAEWEV